MSIISYVEFANTSLISSASEKRRNGGEEKAWSPRARTHEIKKKKKEKNKREKMPMGRTGNRAAGFIQLSATMRCMYLESFEDRAGT